MQLKLVLLATGECSKRGSAAEAQMLTAGVYFRNGTCS